MSKNDEPGYNLTNVVGPPPLLNRNGSGIPTEETMALIRHVKSVVAGLPQGKWVMVVGPMSRKRCQSAANALARHKKDDRIPENLKARTRELYDGGYGVWVSLEEEK